MRNVPRIGIMANGKEDISFEYMNAAGIPDRILVAMTRAFSYDVDFQREIHPNDRFDIVFEQLVDAWKRCAAGGFEVVLHTDKAIFHANSVSGLVESLVGVVPGGGGVKETCRRESGLPGSCT